jgi:membrane-associated phospholipid phosphatase
MKQKLAKTISYLFAPPFNLMAIFLVLATSIYADNNLIIKTLLLAFIFGLLFPVVVFVYLRKKGKIINDDATEKGERTLPYAIGIGLSIIALLLSYLFELHSFILALWSSYILIQTAMIAINRYWKISAHLIGIGIPIAVLFFLFQLNAILFLIIPLIIGWARLTLKVHTPMQVFAGFLLGALPTYFILQASIQLIF